MTEYLMLRVKYLQHDTKKTKKDIKIMHGDNEKSIKSTYELRA